MIEIIPFRYDNKLLSRLSKKIRQKVFVEEQKVNAKLEYDGKDEDAFHYLCFFDEKPVGTARWRFTTEGIKLERFAVIRQYRNQKIGQKLLEFVLMDVTKMPGKIYLHAQEKAVNYYQRAGFVTIGTAFYEAGIKHFKMVLSNKH